jgi:sensor histidine kinase regulating citrate/malate metabolism
MVIKPESILEQAAIGIMGIDTHGHIQYANPLAKQLLNREIPIGTSLETIEPRIAEEIFSCMEQGKSDYTFTLKSQKHDIEILVSLLRNNTDIEGAVCFIRDLEEERASAWMLPNIKEMNLQFKADLDHSYYGI